jgi:hypothetical protein
MTCVVGRIGTCRTQRGLSQVTSKWLLDVEYDEQGDVGDTDATKVFDCCKGQYHPWRVVASPLIITVRSEKCVECDAGVIVRVWSVMEELQF